MNNTISALLTRYESGTLTRRELIAGLAMLATASATASAAGLKGTRIDHLSLQVSDLKRSRDFYVNAFGLSVNTNPRPEDEVRLDLGESDYLVLRRFSPPGKVDHIGMKLEGFNKDLVTQQLRGQGIVPIDEPPNSSTRGGFHVLDPDGFKVQLL
jgi:catechol 2,3-dioxygenase-like lactoylglutathione lyase family enzyme